MLRNRVAQTLLVPLLLAQILLAAVACSGCRPPAHLSRQCDSLDAPVLEVCEPDEFNPFDFPSYWRESVRSERVAVDVWFTHDFDRAMAERVLLAFETAWSRQVDGLGFRAPIPYDPTGGNRYQVFLVRGLNAGVDSIQAAERPGIWWNAWETYMYVNPWGTYGGDILESTIEHEFNHATQAAYDWEELGGVYEMSSNFIQELFYPGVNPDYHLEMSEFQQYPEYPPDYYDDYESSFMYGASLYLFFLQDRYFDGDERFLARIWEGSRSDPEQDAPSWFDGLEKLLPEGVTYVDTVLEFAAWRYYTGAHHDGRLKTAYPPKEEDGVWISRTIGPRRFGRWHRSGRIKMLGTEYVRIERPKGQDSVELGFKGDPGAAWVIQAIPALDGSDSERVDFAVGATDPADGAVAPGLAGGKARLRFGKLKERVLAVTPFPLEGDYLPGGEEEDYRFKLRVDR